MKLKIRVAVISATSALDPKKVALPVTNKRDASTLQQPAPAPFVHRQFLLLVPVESTFSDLKPLLRAHYDKLYSSETTFVPLRRVLKFRDELQCDLDDDFVVSEICDNGELIFAVSELDFHNAKKPKVTIKPTIPSFKESGETSESKTSEPKQPFEEPAEPKKSDAGKSGNTVNADNASTSSTVPQPVQKPIPQPIKKPTEAKPVQIPADKPVEKPVERPLTKPVEQSKPQAHKPVEAPKPNSKPIEQPLPAESLVATVENPPITPCPSPSTIFIPRKSSSFEESSSSEEEMDESAKEENSVFGFALPSIVVTQPKRSEVSILFAADSSSDEDSSSEAAVRKESPVPDPSVIPSLAEVVESVNRAPTPARRGRPKKSDV